jgi:hypothetical protein
MELGGRQHPKSLRIALEILQIVLFEIPEFL